MLKRLWLLDGLIKYTVAAILIGVPLYPKFPLFRISGTFVAIRIEDILLAFAGFLLLAIFVRKLDKYWKDSITKTIMLFLIVGFVSLISAIYITHTVVPHIGLLHWVRRIEYFIPFFLGLEAIERDKKNLAFFSKIIVIVVALAFIYGFGQKYFGWPIIITQNQEYSKGIALRYTTGSHINSTFAGHYDLASFLVLILPIVVSSFFLLKGLRTKIFLTAGFFSGLWLLVNTASRISLVSYLVAVVLSLFLIKRYKAIPLVLVVSVLFIGFSSNLISRYGRIIEVVRTQSLEFNLINYRSLNRLVYAAEDEFVLKRQIATPTPTLVPVFEDRSTNIRLNVEWPRALRAFAKNPFLGTGYSSITLATDNDYLRTLGEVGALGFLAFFLIFGKISVSLVKVLPFDKHFEGIELAFIVGVVGAMPGIFLNAFFIDVFEASKFAIFFWLLIGFTISLTKYAKSE
ncbi:hypothetical protein A2715_05130 [Candidatus Woesebacteria bacterium RIFCSPHIGHO2_01_FULL_39_32]|uniref:O-antigen ligase-related domain-containing protein n=1 Tax=Candidatus Woesebacteria bacterium RIFCSPLOWO2_01_FULL_39_25 TaxID=1802521 RepID=A0A1F8BLN3_9BACT|nr:MAG: hypothetical protein A2124_05135 [Candidatus Woesebacteria bacterium GWB1_37_5]OGM25401.1 MAG: hypothetical protein A2715_05130 [Candidatus Woesebacteria bacterium RIFCSPHIGHO2_01_FULL_39_32]OGM38507.1 MAG: hypothetical protein A3F01_04090 [Candidatus Woesebacteria bacterium RIFCSPHIGHO2_12_FULL_38_11]OGM64932.1 MAG: hypothetical protein A2893_04740 [Candidatus Woesebacteria bacterium RIFCSPLOWO2_01_FULL_39_25]